MIGGDVICAGSVGQVYRVSGDAIEPMPPLKVDGAGVTIEDLAGRDATDFVVVTSDGYAARFDGSTWRVLDLPANGRLASVCMLEGDGYAVAGDGGIVVIGADGECQTVVPSDDERSYYGVGAEGELIYAAHLGGIDLVSAGALTPLDIEPSGDLEFAVLRAAPDGVWSFAGTTIGLIRAGRWHTIAG